MSSGNRWWLLLLATMGGASMTQAQAQDIERLQSAVAPVMALSDKAVHAEYFGRDLG